MTKQTDHMDELRALYRLTPDAPATAPTDPAPEPPHPFDVAMDAFAPMRPVLEERWIARQKRQDAAYTPSLNTNYRYYMHARSTRVIARYIRRFMQLEDPQKRYDRVREEDINDDPASE